MSAWLDGNALRRSGRIGTADRAMAVTHSRFGGGGASDLGLRSDVGIVGRLPFLARRRRRANVCGPTVRQDDLFEGVWSDDISRWARGTSGSGYDLGAGGRSGRRHLGRSWSASWSRSALNDTVWRRT